MAISPIRIPRRLAWCVLLALCLSACKVSVGGSSGGGSGGGVKGVGVSGAATNPTGTAQLLLADAQSDEISSLVVTVIDVRLISSPGNVSNVAATDNLLETDRRVDLLDLNPENALLVEQFVPAGTYTAASITFSPAPGDSVARDLFGEVVPLTFEFTEANASFRDGDVLVEELGLVKLRLEVDIDASLRDDLAIPGGKIFAPVLNPEDRTDDALDLSLVVGFITALDPVEEAFELEVLDPETDFGIGLLDVELDRTFDTAFFDQSGALLLEPVEFFDSAQLGDRVEVLGLLGTELRDGAVDASLVRLEPRPGGLVELNGTVLDVGEFAEEVLELDELGEAVLDVGEIVEGFILRLEFTERGVEIATQTLLDLGNPAAILVETLPAPIVTVERPKARTGSTLDLEPGQRLRVSFNEFVADPPFRARRIDIRDERPSQSGTIVDIAGLPESFLINLDPSDPAIFSRQVDDAATDVRSRFVELPADIVLDLDSRPALEAEDLLPEMKVRTIAEFTPISTPTAPELAVDEVRVRPGRLFARVDDANELLGSFEVDVINVVDPFGRVDEPGSGPVPFNGTVVFADEAVVKGEARSVEEFFALFDSLSAREVLEVLVLGVSDAEGTGDIIAYEVLTTLITPPDTPPRP